MLIYYLLLCLHVLGACVWVGGHLVLAGASLRFGGYPLLQP